MKRLFFHAFSFIVALSSLYLYSCDNDDTDYSVRYPNALVTIKTNSSTGQVYFQLDDSTTILPVNIDKSLYGKKELRALTNFKVQEGQSGHYSKSAYVNWVDTILTKNMAQSFGDKNNEKYGNRTKHAINLVKGDKPYEVVLHHNAFGDTRGFVSDGLVAFSLKDLPDTQGKSVDLILKWQSFSGMKSVKFKYTTRK